MNGYCERGRSLAPERREVIRKVDHIECSSDGRKPHLLTDDSLPGWAIWEHSESESARGRRQHFEHTTLHKCRDGFRGSENIGERTKRLPYVPSNSARVLGSLPRVHPD